MAFGKRQWSIWVLTGALLCVPAAHAYLDPVTGSMIIQGLIGAIAGAAVAAKLYWRRLKAWFARVTGKVPESADATNSAESPAPEKD